MCSEIQYKVDGTCTYKDRITINSDLKMVPMIINNKPNVIMSFPFSKLVNFIESIQIRPSSEVSISCFIETDSYTENVKYKTIHDEERFSSKEPFMLKLKEKEHKHIYLYVYEPRECTTLEGYTQSLTSGVCKQTNKCAPGYFKDNNRCIQIGSACNTETVMSPLGSCLSKDSSCPNPDQYTKFYESSFISGIKECKPVCHLVSEDGYAIKKFRNSCTKTEQCAEGFTYYNNKCVKENEPCEPDKIMINGVCSQKERKCTYNHPDTFLNQNKDCSITCKNKTTDNFKIKKKNYKTCLKTNECADGFIKHKDYCIEKSFGKCVAPGRNVITKQGVCTESYLCPKPDHLHAKFSNNCIPVCRDNFQGFKIKYDHETNSCMKQNECIDDHVLTKGVCIKKQTDCSHLKHLLDPFSKQLNGNFTVTNDKCELTCDPYNKKTRTTTRYKYNDKEEKIQCYSSKSDCYFKGESYIDSKKQCVKDIPIMFINKGNTRIIVEIINDFRSTSISLSPQEKKKIFVSNHGNTYLNSKENIPVKILFVEEQKVVSKYEQYLQEPLPLQDYVNGSMVVLLYTKTEVHKYKEEKEENVTFGIPHGIFTDYV